MAGGPDEEVHPVHERDRRGEDRLEDEDDDREEYERPPHAMKKDGVETFADGRRTWLDEAGTLDDGRLVRPEAVVEPPRPGQAFAYVTDTRPCEAAVTLARDAALLYHEATFGDDLPERAVETGHSIARQAAEVARRAQVKKLILGHFSAYLVLFVLAYGVLHTAPQPLKRGTYKLIAFVWAFSFSVLMECLQLLTPLRQFEVEDLGLNLAGTMAGLVAISVQQGKWNSK